MPPMLALSPLTVKTHEIEFISASFTSVQSKSFTVQRPSNTIEGDYLFYFVTVYHRWNAYGYLETPAGWKTLTSLRFSSNENPQEGTGYVTFGTSYLFYRKIDSTDSDSYAFTSGFSGDYIVGSMFAYRWVEGVEALIGMFTTDIIDYYGRQQMMPVNYTSVSTLGRNRKLVTMVRGGTSGGLTYVPPNGETTRILPSDSGNSTIFVADQLIAMPNTISGIVAKVTWIPWGSHFYNIPACGIVLY